MAELWSNLLVAADIDGNLDGRLKWMSSWLWFITTPSRMWFLLMIKGGMCLSVSLRGLQPANIHSPILRWLTLTSTKPWPWLYLFLFVWPQCRTDVTILLYHPSDMESNLVVCPLQTKLDLCLLPWEAQREVGKFPHTIPLLLQEGSWDELFSCRSTLSTSCLTFQASVSE